MTTSTHGNAPLIARIASHALHPALLCGIPLAWGLAQWNGWPLSKTFLVYAGLRFALLLALEFLFPARREWAMTWASFWRDLKFAAVNGGTLLLLKALIAAAAIDASRFNTGLLREAPLWLEVIALLLAFEFLQYWLHRLSHEARGPAGAFLWRVHAAHHLPTGVYLLMHAVGHPLNVLLVALVNAPLVLLGASSEALFFFNALVGLHGLISHFNFDLRSGPLNYLVVGTELHRYHHSARVDEAKNFGVVTPFWDIVFGTFVLRPGRMPAQLGVTDPGDYPESGNVLAVLALPFRRNRSFGEREPRPVENQKGIPHS